MSRSNCLIIAVLFFAQIPFTAAQSMNNAMLFGILDSVSDSINGEAGMWQLKYNERMMLVITDERHNRMRIISPVELVKEVDKHELEAAMIANFHTTLDVRYAISEEILWVAYIHPLNLLTEDQVRDALLQVYRAAETFGTTYSSSELQFPGSERPERSREPKKKM